MQLRQFLVVAVFDWTTRFAVEASLALSRAHVRADLADLRTIDILKDD
ncbi:hypothetical protein [Bradyrhizobium lablabi]|nr:hypothetical protein [Bradyrhizobium lablabi]